MQLKWCWCMHARTLDSSSFNVAIDNRTRKSCERNYFLAYVYVHVLDKLQYVIHVHGRGELAFITILPPATGVRGQGKILKVVKYDFRGSLEIVQVSSSLGAGRVKGHSPDY